MGLKIYKAGDFDRLVKDLEKNYGKEELISIKLDCHRDNRGYIEFWYAVVITKDKNVKEAPKQDNPYQHTWTSPMYGPQEPYRPNTPWQTPYCITDDIPVYHVDENDNSYQLVNGKRVYD